MEKIRYMISDAAHLVNVESHVLRYWEDELELTIPRNEMGHRYYTKDNIKDFQKIKELKDQGYQLKAIRMILHNGNVEELVSLPETGATLPAQAGTSAQTSETLADPAASVSGQVLPEASASTKGQVLPEPSATAGRQAAAGVSASAGRQAPAGGAASAERQMPADIPSSVSRQAPAIVPSSAVGTSVAQASAASVDAEERMSQFRELMSDIVGRAISANNEELSQSIGVEVGERVLKEMDYLFREQEEAQQERFRKLDAAIRHGIKGKKSLFKKEKKKES